MCQFETSWRESNAYIDEIPNIVAQLDEMEKDGLLVIQPSGIIVTEKGKPFVRNICMAFDVRLKRKLPATSLFSMTV
jgi:oxygen-independent coproporphyrinogen-3 oxidase